MRNMKKVVGVFDKFNRGTVKHIDFTYPDCIVVWVEYQTKSIAYRWIG